MLNCFLLLEEPLALSLRERWGHGLRRGRQAVAWPSRISGLPGEHDRMMGKAPISTGLRRQAAGDAYIVGTIGKLKTNFFQFQIFAIFLYSQFDI